jgi:hypothetical protein
MLRKMLHRTIALITMAKQVDVATRMAEVELQRSKQTKKKKKNSRDMLVEQICVC